MGTLKNFAYDDANYKLVRTYTAGVSDVASATAFARFRSRAAVVITNIMLAASSVASVAKVIFTVERGGSVNSTFTLASCTTVGNVTQVAVDITLSSVELLALKHSDTGDYLVTYNYQVLPGESLYAK